MLSSPEFWMLSGRNIIPWDEPKTYANILDEIFSKYNPKLGNYSIDFSYDLPSCLMLLHDSEENDYDYIKRIASQTGSLFYSVDGGVMFKPISPIETYGIAFNGELGDYVKDIKLTSNVVGISKAVSMSYVKDDDYENIVTISETLSGQIGNGSTVDSITSNIDESNSLNFIKCEITCDITPKFKVGSAVVLSNFDSIIDNKYILTSISHKFENTEEGAQLTSKMTLNSDSIKIKPSW